MALNQASPTVQEMKGVSIRCVFYRPFDRLPIEKEGIVTELKTYQNTLFMWVKATDGKAKWVSEFDFIAYVRSTKTTAEAVV